MKNYKKRKFTDLVEASQAAKELGLTVFPVDFTLYTTGNVPVKYFVGTEAEFLKQKSIRSPKHVPTGKPAHRPSLTPARVEMVMKFVDDNERFLTSDLVKWTKEKFQCHESTARVYASQILNALVDKGQFSAQRTSEGNLYTKKPVYSPQ